MCSLTGELIIILEVVCVCQVAIIQLNKFQVGLGYQKTFPQCQLWSMVGRKLTSILRFFNLAKIKKYHPLYSYSGD